MRLKLRDKIVGMLATTLLASITSSCSDTDYSYDQQHDVDVEGWRLTDTLWYELEVLDEPTISRPLLPEHDYQMELSVRHLTSYPYHQLPLSFAVHAVDTTGGWHLVPVAEDDSLRQWTFSNYRILPTLSAGESHWAGYTTGDFCQMTYHVVPATIRFPHPGFYRLSLIHETPDSLLTGVLSLGISLY